MTCGLRIARKPKDGSPKRGHDKAFRPATDEMPTVCGTWDFKWPAGTTIRVAFQDFPGGSNELEFQHARERIKALAGAWETAVQEYADDPKTPESAKEVAQVFSRRGVSLHFVDESWPEPVGSEAGEDLRGVRNRSRYAPSHVRRADYDVLVSLEPFPIVIRDPFDPAEQEVKLLLPTSELGSYALRVDYGVPTVYLGPPRKQSLEDYLQTNLAAHAVVHEFGHVLGLPHTHQNPWYAKRPYRKVGELKKIFALGNDLEEADSLDSFLEAHFLREWPKSREFSDWPREPGELEQLDSVMAHPLLKGFLEGGDEAEKVGGELRTVLKKTSPDDQVPIKPTRSDIEYLVGMYT